MAVEADVAKQCSGDENAVAIPSKVVYGLLKVALSITAITVFAGSVELVMPPAFGCRRRLGFAGRQAWSFWSRRVLFSPHIGT